MKAQIQRQGQAQDQQRWQEVAAADPAYREWHDLRTVEDQQEFNDWLDTPEGHEWLNTQAEDDEEHTGRAIWNHDGFNQVGSHA